MLAVPFLRLVLLTPELMQVCCECVCCVCEREWLCGGVRVE